MSDNIKLSIVIPSYLEEENLRLILPRLIRVMDSLKVSYEVIVVDTGEPLDNTRDACEINNVIYVNRKQGNSFGDAIRTGINMASGKWLLFMDADGSHTPEFIPSLYKHIEEYDIVIASRYVKGGHLESSKILVLMSRILNFTYSIVLNIKCNDISNNFKIYRTHLLKEINLYSNNFDIIEEILFKISKKYKNIKIKEVPFCFKERMFGRTKRNLILFIITYIYTLIRLRFKK